MSKGNKRKRRGRRGDGEGSIYKHKDGRWLGQVSLGYDADGKRIRKSFSGKTRKEVADKIAAALHEVTTGTYIEPTTITLGEWLDRWMTSYKKAQLKQSTYESYDSMIETYIKPVLGDVPMAKLQGPMLQDFYNEQLESGRRKTKGGLSNRTVRYLHSIIRQALQKAVKENMLPRNPADTTNPPVAKSGQVEPLTKDQLLTFFETAKDDRLYAAYVLAATTGLRRGELLGLCWDCVDLKGGVITVQRQLLALEDGPTMDDGTKSKRGRRSIALTDDATRELKAHRKRQAQEMLLIGEAYQKNNLVFAEADGTYLDPREFTKHFQRLLKQAGLPKVRLHDLRHTHASLLLARGVHPKVVQERLGHSSITMTLDLYSHLTPGLDEAAAATLNGLLKEKGPAEQQSQDQ